MSLFPTLVSVTLGATLQQTTAAVADVVLAPILSNWTTETMPGQGRRAITASSTKKRGGRKARQRRRQRRSQQNSAVPYGPVIHVPLRYFGTFTLDQELQGWDYGHLLYLGNQQLFSCNYNMYKSFREFRIKRATITLHWNTYRTKTWVQREHPDGIAVSCCSILTDMETTFLGEKFVSFDAICAQPGAKVVNFSSGSLGVTRHVWIPTEPTDKDWRFTNNDGLCNLYMFWRGYDLTVNQHGVNVVVECVTHVSLRTMDFDKTCVEPTQADIEWRRVCQLTKDANAAASTLQSPRPSTSSAQDDFDLVEAVERIQIRLPASAEEVGAPVSD